MAKKQYQSKVAQQAAAFIAKTEPEVRIEKQELLEAKAEAKEEVIEPVKIQISAEKESTEKEIKKDYEDSEILLRQTFYITYEERAAIDLICFEENIGISELLREVLDAGLESIYPNIFEKVKKQASILKNQQGKKDKKRKVYEKLKKNYA